ncbi:MAG: hypothetical protein DRN65_01420 [Thaumarchaeota archaeon]|nr:MAG: hypothetical protein DRN65_01420 [Nitrososphaerota archaeon]
MMGWFSSTTMVGRLTAPITAGAVLSLAGFKEAYLLCGIIGAIALVSMSQIPSPRSERKSNSPGKFSRDIFQVLFNGDVVTAGVVMAVTYFAVQSLETFLPIYLGGLGVEPWLIGAIFTIELFTIMILKPYAGRLSDAVGRIKMISLGLVTSSIGITGITFLKSCEGLIFSIIIFSIGVAFTTAATPPLVSELVTREKYGAAIGAMETIKDVGQALGPIFTGMILMYVAFEDALLVISGLLIFALPLIYLRLR